jgi:hypothetical protein
MAEQDEDFLNLRYDVDRHESEFDKLAQRITDLEHELQFVIKHSQQFRQSIVSIANQKGNPGFDQAEVERCRRFIEKYGVEPY